MAYPTIEDWQCVSFDQKDELPKQPGIYAARSGDEVVYVGRSKNIWKRWKRHTRHKEFEEIAKSRRLVIHWLLLPEDELAHSESELISTLKPVMNGNNGVFCPPKCPVVESLAGQFWRPVKLWIDYMQPYSPMERFIISMLFENVQIVNSGQGWGVDEVWAEFDERFFDYQNIRTPLQRQAFRECLDILCSEGIVVKHPILNKYAIAHRINKQEVA